MGMTTTSLPSEMIGSMFMFSMGMLLGMAVHGQFLTFVKKSTRQVHFLLI